MREPLGLWVPERNRVLGKRFPYTVVGPLLELTATTTDTVFHVKGREPEGCGQ